jgi:hypothetical protein
MYRDCLLEAATTLRAAALYIERHGYYLPLHRVLSGITPDPDWESGYAEDDHFDETSPTPSTPAASEIGAIIMAVYGTPNWNPVPPSWEPDPLYTAYLNAVTYLQWAYDPDGYDWVFPYELTAALRDVATDCEYLASLENPPSTFDGPWK